INRDLFYGLYALVVFGLIGSWARSAGYGSARNYAPLKRRELTFVRGTAHARFVDRRIRARHGRTRRPLPPRPREQLCADAGPRGEALDPLRHSWVGDREQEDVRTHDLALCGSEIRLRLRPAGSRRENGAVSHPCRFA